jgi:hypothetical protein
MQNLTLFWRRPNPFAYITWPPSFCHVFYRKTWPSLHAILNIDKREIDFAVCHNVPCWVYILLPIISYTFIVQNYVIALRACGCFYLTSSILAGLSKFIIIHTCGLIYNRNYFCHRSDLHIYMKDSIIDIAQRQIKTTDVVPNCHVDDEVNRQLTSLTATLGKN